MSAIDTMAYLDQKEITHFLAQELFQQYMTYEGLNSGVPTRTTPTVTPTTLRNIEQTFIELQKTEHHENEAGFVPPLVHNIGNNQYIPVSEAADIYNSKSNSNQNLWHSNLSQSSLSDCDTRSTPPLSISGGYEGGSAGGGQTTRRNMGGRKPTRDVNLSPEEEERRRIRRERNKAAAARCRKRRVDHTNQLIMETEDLERKRQAIQDEIQRLKEQQDELTFVISQHKHSGKCRKRPNNNQQQPDIKPFNIYAQQPQIYQDSDERVKTEPMESLNTPTANEMFILPSTKKPMLSAPISKPSRPNSLNVGVTAPQCMTDIVGIPISTPSSGLHFNFDSLMGGGTGLTPVSAPLAPSCSTQQRNIPISIADMCSPDACNPPKLVSL